MNQLCLEASGRREKRGKTTKPKIISLANHNKRRQSNGPVRSGINTTGHPAGALARANRDKSAQVTIGFGFNFDWLQKVPRKFQANHT